MANSILIRKDIENFTPTELAALRDAYQKMQALSPTDNRSWVYWAEYHGFNRYRCWHHGNTGPGGTQRKYDLFLSWHRGYLVHWVHVALDQNAGFILPWWNWSSAQSDTNGLPAAFTAPTVNGQRNSLFSGPVPAMDGNAPRQTTRANNPAPPLPAGAQNELIQPDLNVDPNAVVQPNQMMNTGADWTNWVLSLAEFSDFQEQLQDLHDQIHGWVGGDMGNISIEAFDPIFWSHHCYIDRLWYLWQLKNGTDNLGNLADHVNMILAPWPYTVQDVLSIRNLGYEYVESEVSVTP